MIKSSGTYLVEINGSAQQIRLARKSKRCNCKIIHSIKQGKKNFAILEVKDKCFIECPNGIHIIRALQLQCDESEEIKLEMRKIQQQVIRKIGMQKVIVDLGEEERVVVL